MNELMIVAIVVLYIAVIALAIAVVALGRQIGVLLERVAPAGALMTGKSLNPGETAPEMDLYTLQGDVVHVGGVREDQRSSLVFFLSPSCPMCDVLAPAVRSLAHDERAWLDVILASDGDEADHEGYVQRKKLSDLPYVVSRELGLRFRVGQLPHAVLVSSDGTVAAAGLINSREHLDSLIEAKQRGVASLQEYLERKTQQSA
ncbi:methylamine dehydrogenase [Pseudohaliea sp.]|uniref:methylamine dehydrogenase n=1 Tax=Pseudohaliea sp. TaxID=2740289 RepID=UPI0032EBDB91